MHLHYTPIPPTFNVGVFCLKKCYYNSVAEHRTEDCCAFFIHFDKNIKISILKRH